MKKFTPYLAALGAFALMGTSIALADTPALTLSITSPSASSTYATSSLVTGLAGQVNGNSGTTTISWQNSATNATGTANLASSSWDVSGIALATATPNLITVTAQDATNQVASSAITVSFIAPVVPTPTTTVPTTTPVVTSTTTLNIRVASGEHPKRLVNLRSEEKLKVVLLGSRELNVNDINGKTIVLAGATSIGQKLRDVNKDGYVDLIAEFRARAMTELRSTSTTNKAMNTELTLTAKTKTGTTLTGKVTMKVKNLKARKDEIKREELRKKQQEELKKKQEKLKAEMAAKQAKIAAEMKARQEKLQKEMKARQEKLKAEMASKQAKIKEKLKK